MEELSLNILDIAKNSTAAGAKNVAITILENRTDASLSITIEDDGCGMDAEKLRRVTDPFYTTRKTRSVGLGIPFFKMEAEMTGGGFKISSTPGVGTRVKAVFRTSHMDFIPLGDVGSSLVTLIGGSPEVEFTLLHCLTDESGEKRFEFSTKEIRSALGEGISLAETEVLAWLGEYFREGYAELYGE